MLKQGIYEHIINQEIDRKIPTRITTMAVAVIRSSRKQRIKLFSLCVKKRKMLLAIHLHFIASD
jgi:hypothetical protein